jgi:signal transduction protein with GAF and PtsI domain
MSESQANRGPVADARDLRRVEHAVARILADTARPVEVYERTLEAIGRSMGWRIGAVWELVPEAGGLRCVCAWRAGERTDIFQELTESITLLAGEGLPGRVLASGEPAWLIDAPSDKNFPRADAARSTGLRAGCAFPLRSPRGVVGVMEFFAGELREPDERSLATMAALGSLVGQVVARHPAEDEVRGRE